MPLSVVIFFFCGIVRLIFTLLEHVVHVYLSTGCLRYAAFVEWAFVFFLGGGVGWGEGGSENPTAF